MPQPKKKVRPLSAQCEALGEWIPSDPTRPCYTTVRNAFIQRFADWYVRAGFGTSDETERLEKQWRMLADLLFRDPPTTRNRDWRNLRTQPQIVRVCRLALRVAADHPGKGKPRSDLRRLAVQALDLRHSDPTQWTWQELATHFGIYRCNEVGHDSKCQKKWEDYSKCQKRRANDLKREAQYVTKELQELGVQLPRPAR